MKSAYATLGVPENAAKKDIKEAYARASVNFSMERMMSDPAVFERYIELREAYKTLVSPELRLLHDRRLAGAVPYESVPARRRSARKAGSGAASYLGFLAAWVIAMSAIGAYYAHARQEAHTSRVTQELALMPKADPAPRQLREEVPQAEQALSVPLRNTE